MKTIEPWCFKLWVLLLKTSKKQTLHKNSIIKLVSTCFKYIGYIFKKKFVKNVNLSEAKDLELCYL